jgi:hypothetical protein
MTGHAIIDPKSPGKERGTTGKAGSIGGMALTKKNALLRQIIKHRRSGALIPIAAQMIGTTGVNVKIEDTHLLSPLLADAGASASATLSTNSLTLP